jgi:hypothetical protein
MNIKLTTKEFDNFILLYLLDKVKEFDNLMIEDNELFFDFIDNLKKKSFFTLLNKAYLNSSMMTKLQTNRIIDKKEDSDNISLLM